MAKRPWNQGTTGLLLIVALLVSLAGHLRPAVAEEGRLEVYEPSELPVFLATYRCAVIERLKIIHANKEREMDRFLILAPKFRAQSYVQCLFLDGDTRMLCEASSGFYATLPDEDRRYRMAPQGLAALARLGFSTDDSEGNFQRMIDFSGAPEFALIADLILSTLYEVFGARVRSELEWKSPLADFDPRDSACVPIS